MAEIPLVEVLHGDVAVFLDEVRGAPVVGVDAGHARRGGVTAGSCCMWGWAVGEEEEEGEEEEVEGTVMVHCASERCGLGSDMRHGRGNNR